LCTQHDKTFNPLKSLQQHLAKLYHSFSSSHEKIEVSKKVTMKNLERLLDLFLNNEIVPFSKIRTAFPYSERKIRTILRDLKAYERRYGFEIKTVYDQGYYLQIIQPEVFSHFREKLKNTSFVDLNNREYRRLVIILLLLQTNDNITITKIAELLEISRPTITSDLKQIGAILSSYGVLLVEEKHKGIKLIGEEVKIRKLFSAIMNETRDYDYLTGEYFEFLKNNDFQEVADCLHGLLEKYDIAVTQPTFNALMVHIKILVYRLYQQNKITTLNIHTELIDEKYFSLAKEFITFLTELYQIEIQDQETDFFALQIFSKSISATIPNAKRSEMMRQIEYALKKVDKEYSTKFNNDPELKNALLLHIYPLLLRITFDFTLNTSLISSVSAQYTNAFLVSIRFVEYHQELSQFHLSRDEIGYLALHFATFLERESQQILNHIKHIVLIDDAKRSSSQLLKTQLASLFNNATILVKNSYDFEKYQLDDIDLIFTIHPLNQPIDTVTVIPIKEVITEEDLLHIKNEVIFCFREKQHSHIGMERLFYKDLFFTTDKTDYMQILQETSEQMVRKGYAQEGFTESVIEREKRFNTIYEHGIAGPHSMKQNAITDSIAVIIPKKPIIYEGKSVQCILLINIREKHLFLYQEISDFLIKLIKQPNLIKKIAQVDSFMEFKQLIQTIV
jgi:lichenan operon transcriptional antiterminator